MLDAQDQCLNEVSAFKNALDSVYEAPMAGFAPKSGTKEAQRWNPYSFELG